MNPNETPIEYTGEVHKWHGRFLPHWHVDGGIFFVTYSLRDAVPTHQLKAMSKEREHRVHKLEQAGELTPKLLREIDDEYLMRADELLDEHWGSRLLEEQAAAEIVAEAFEFFDGERYDLISWVIMPTHIHAALRARLQWRLSDIVGSWKSFTAKEIKKALGLSQKHVWQNDYYDRLVRTVEGLDRTREYIWENPENAGFEDWEWREQYDFGVI